MRARVTLCGFGCAAVGKVVEWRMLLELMDLLKIIFVAYDIDAGITPYLSDITQHEHH